MSDKKRRLTTVEVKKVLDYYKNGGGQYSSGCQIDDEYYNTDDVFSQFLLMHDSVMSIIVETMVLGRELK